MERIGVTMQRESVDDVMTEGKELLARHWEECACWKDRVKLSVDGKRYRDMETAGRAACFTMRDNGVMIGYMVVLSAPHIHYKDDVFSHVDVLFLDQDRRKGLSAVRFMKWVESEVKKMGASVMTYHIKIFHDYPAIFDRLGYEKIEVIYAKCLKE